MNKKISLLALLMVMTLTVNAQLLWKVEGNGAARPSYLFGTHHLAPVAMLDTLPGIADALASVDAVYGEMVMAEAASPEGQMAMMRLGAAPADSTLTSLLTPAQADSLQAVIERYIGPVAVKDLDAVKPAMVSVMIAMGQNRAAMPEFTGTTSLDEEIQRRGAAAGKDVKGFETLDQQCKAMFGYSIVEQAGDLMDAVRNDSHALDMARSLASAYMSGDLNALLDVIENPVAGMSASEADRLINSRNADWLRILAGLLPAASVFVAVGAGHLPGPKGIIAGLRGMGYTVTPVE